MHEDLKDLLSEKHSKVFYLLVTAYIRDTFFSILFYLKIFQKGTYLITLFIDLNVGKIMYIFATFLILYYLILVSKLVLWCHISVFPA